MSLVKIRPGLPSDVEAVARLCAALWPDEPVTGHEAHVASILSGKPLSRMPLVLVVAEIGSEVVDRCVNFRKCL